MKKKKQIDKPRKGYSFSMNKREIGMCWQQRELQESTKLKEYMGFIDLRDTGVNVPDWAGGDERTM